MFVPRSPSLLSAVVSVAMLGSVVAACTDPAPADGADANIGDTSALWPECTPAAPCATCPTEGTGRTKGEVIADIAWTDDSGAPLALHSKCGVRRALVIIETASWCTICSERVPLFKQWAAQYHPRGVDFMYVVGENASGQPATVGDVAKYRADHALGVDFELVADPKWTKILKAIAHTPGVGVLPLFAVLDGEMRLRYLGDGAEKTAFHAATDALAAVVGYSFKAESGCEGSCGSLAPSGCWCDEFCAQLGNCCADNCTTCGNCQ